MIKLKLFQAGYCRHCQRMTLQKGRLQRVRYPSLCMLIQHPQHGNILFDTGYSEEFMSVSAKFPGILYRMVTPVTLTQDLLTQLQSIGISADEIDYIVISHFHSDHLGGLKDFSKAKFICHAAAWHSVKHLSALRGLLKAFLPELLPHDFPERLMLLQQSQRCNLPDILDPFRHGYDLFGDQSLYIVELPGHAAGHIGMYFVADETIPTLLIADSCWHSESFREKRYPSSITRLIHEDYREYKATIDRLHELHIRQPQITIMPSHCEHIAKQYVVNDVS